MCDYESVAKSLQCCASDSEPCEHCNCELEECNPKTIMAIAADAIEELLAVCRDVAAFVICFADDDEVSAEVLCRKLHKIGVVEKDGAWWALPEPPKEDAE